MNIKKAIKYGALLWVLMFVGVSILGFIPYFASMGEFGFVFSTPGIIANFVLSFVFSYIVGKKYFSDEKVNCSQAFLAFIPVLATGIVLDAIITVPIFVKSYSAFYGDWVLWTGILIGACGFVFASKK